MTGTKPKITPRAGGSMGRRSPKPTEPAAPDMSRAYPEDSRAEEPMKRTSLDLPLSLHRRLKVLSVTDGRPLRTLIIDALEAAYPAEK